MLTLTCLENISFKTPDTIITKKPGESLKVNNVQFAVNLVEAKKAEFEMDSLDMQELMLELIRLDRETDSDLYLDERIFASRAVVRAYREGTKQQFIENVLALIRLYFRCRA